MPTVEAGLVPLFDALAGDKRDTIKIDSKTALLNAAKTEVWKLYVGLRTEDNWWLQQSQNDDFGLDTFFPVLDTEIREYDLPNNFHQLRSTEIVTPEATSVVMRKSSITDPQFQIRRQDIASRPGFSDIEYDLIGTDPGQMILAGFPTAVLDVRLWYIRKPTAWTTPAALIDEFPEGSYILMAEWAVQRHLLGLSSGKWKPFLETWNSSVGRWMLSLDRDTSGPDIVLGFMGS